MSVSSLHSGCGRLQMMPIASGYKQVTVIEFGVANGFGLLDSSIAPFNFLRESRLFKNAKWLSHMYTLHVLDHLLRFSLRGTGTWCSTTLT
jgi:hypothetical protein